MNLKYIIMRAGFKWLRIGFSGEHSNLSLSSVQGGGFLDQLNISPSRMPLLRGIRLTSKTYM
jgi:hypothetical protein